MMGAKGRESMQRLTPVLWGLVIVLLILNLAVLYAVNRARLIAIETLNEVETTLDSLANEVIVYNVEINQAVPMKADVPFNQTMEVPLNTVIPIDQELAVPIQTLAGEIVVDVPLKTDFPIDIVVPVDFNETIHVDTEVELSTTLPVEIDIAQTQLAGYLEQAKLDIARLRSRLTLGKTLDVDKRAVVAASDTEAGAAESDAQSQAVSAEASAETTPTSETTHKSDPAAASQPAPTGSASSSGDATANPDLDLCDHVYWPLRSGTTWTYNSPDTSYTQRADNVSGSQVHLSTQYEGRDIQFSLVCYQEGLGGSFVGDMRRITELGDLNFSNPHGMFLPRPEMMEVIGSTWVQEFDVTGTVQARQEDNPVMGRISRGRAVAAYTPTGFETVETPLGSREALRIKQELNLELNIDFDLAGQPIPTTETVNLTSVYWFAKGIGPVKVHWQGGTIQYDATIDRTPLSQQSSVPALAEDQLVFVCVLSSGGSSECIQLSGISQPDLTIPPDSELEIQGFAFPVGVGSNEDIAGVGETATSEPIKEPTVVDGTPEGDDDWSDLLAYVEAVKNLGERLYEAAQDFLEAALKFRNGQLTLDEFKEAFLAFKATARSLIQEINQLSPPPEAEAIHQELTDGLAKCDRAVDLMDEWFDSQDSGTGEAIVLLVTECVEEVEAAGDELNALVAE